MTRSISRFSVVTLIAAIGLVGCSDDPDCSSDSDCADGKICRDSACVEPECTTASTCPGTDTECQTRTCNAGRCGIDYAASGTAVADQAPSDCTKSQCDGNGDVISVADDSDSPPDDGNACTVAACNSGDPVHNNVADGTDCGGGNKCYEGVCGSKECSVPADCGTNAECKTYKCVSNTCDVDYTAAGTPTETQISGDCKKSQCDGSGNLVTVDDDTDRPADDGNECTVAACSSGNPVHDNVTDGTGCSGGKQCYAGVCRDGCSVPADCSTDTACKTYKCVSNTCGVDNTAAGTLAGTQTPGDCKKSQCDGHGNLVTVDDDTDRPADDGNECTVAACSSGNPVHDNVTDGTGCSGGKQCYAGVCRDGCSVPADCGTDTACKTYKCVSNTCGVDNTAAGTLAGTQTPGDCKKSQCDGHGEVEEVNDDSDLPVDGNECTDDVCTAGSPSNPPKAARTACTQDGGRMCDGVRECVECVDVGDCPAAANQCQLAECTVGICDLVNLDLGPAPTGQTPGNCKALWCDGEGHVEEVNEDTNEPAPTDCAVGVCQSGSLEWLYEDEGWTCDAGAGVCDGAGNCVEPGPKVVEWEKVESGKSGNLRAIWGSADDFWIAGDTSTLLRWNGTQFSDQTQSPSKTLNELWGSNANDVWVGGIGAFLHWDGTSWTAVPNTPSGTIYGLWGFGPNDVWALGSASLVSHYVNGTWSTFSAASFGTNTWFWGAYGASATDVWLVGLEGTSGPGRMFRWNGTALVEVTAALPAGTKGLRGIWGLAADDIWVCGSEGTMLHWDGTAWTAHPTGVTAHLTAIGGSQSNDLWATGYSGTLLHWDGTEWKAHSLADLGVTGTLWAVQTLGDTTWAVGNNGLILRTK